MQKIKYYPVGWLGSNYTTGSPSLWKLKASTTQELILKSDFANQSNISEMQLMVAKAAAVDKEGRETIIWNFPEPRKITIKGIFSGESIKSRFIENLKPGVYTHLKLYTSLGNSEITFTDGLTQPFQREEEFQFKIEGGLKIDEASPKTIRMWFELAPFDFWKRLRSSIPWSNKSSPIPRKLAYID